MITVIRGPMFAGKSEELVRRLNRLQYARQTYLAFKPAIDNRYSNDEIATHNGVKIKAHTVNDATEISRIVAAEGKGPVIAIDEGQFFPREDILEVVLYISRDHHVIVSGLDTDFRGYPFGAMGDLLAIAQEDVHLRAVCVVCGKPATRTQRFTNGEPSSWDEPVILVEADNYYQARCSDCHVVRCIRNERGGRESVGDNNEIVKEPHTSGIVNCQKPISVSFAKKLEYALEVGASFWINLQSNYEKNSLFLKKLTRYQVKNSGTNSRNITIWGISLGSSR